MLTCARYSSRGASLRMDRWEGAVKHRKTWEVLNTPESGRYLFIEENETKTAIYVQQLPSTVLVLSRGSDSMPHPHLAGIPTTMQSPPSRRRIHALRPFPPCAMPDAVKKANTFTTHRVSLAVA